VRAPTKGAAALALLLAAGGLAVAAGKPRVAVLRTQFEGPVPEVSRVRLSERVVEGLAGAGFEVSAGEVLKSALKKGPPPETCKTEGCYREIADRLALDYVVVALIAVKQKNYDLQLELIGRDGRARGEERGKCELCGIQEVEDKLDRLAQALTSHLDARSAAPARVSIQSQPAGASVTVDGREAGATPLALELPPGGHDLELRAPGYSGVLKKITIESGAKESFTLDLPPLIVNDKDGRPVPVSPGPPAPWRLVGWSALIAGAAAVAAGAIVLSTDGHAIKCPEGAILMGAMDCKQNTRLAAGVLLGAGTAALGLGGLVLYLSPAAPAAADRAAAGWTVSARRTF
jgi:hypothetical protein